MSVKNRLGIVAVAVLTAVAAGCGDDSTAGPPGAPAWDLNENGECDPATEDLNGDGECSMLDVVGPPGVSCWDLNENGECDPATEDLNGDDECTVLDCGSSGFSCWDANENGTCDAADEDLNADDLCTVADCYGMPGVTCWDLDESGTCDLATEDTNADGDCTIADCNIPGTACWDADENGACDLATEDTNADGDCTIVDCSGLSDGIVEGTVVDEAGAGIDGATVAFFPGSASATADATGAFTIDLPIGVYSATASATGYTDGSADNISVVAGGTNTLDPIELVAVNPLTASAGADLYQVGYGATVTATGTGAGAATLTYAWTQTGGTAATLTGADTATVSVTMPTLDACLTAAGTGYALRDRTDILPISPRIQGKITLTLTVTGGGFTKTDTMTISAAEPTNSILNVPVGINVFFQGAEAATYAWTLTPPSGGTATLRDAATRVASFIPDVEGTYTLALGTTTFSLVAGLWEGSADGGCNGCHDGSPAPDQFTPFDDTLHSSMMERNIDDTTGHYSGSCLTCHTVGNSAAAANNGFDDVARTAGWTFPATIAAGNWASFVSGYPTVATLANIQCENCHGPNDSAAHMAGDSRMSMNSGMCAQCHDSGSHHYRPAEWAATPHGNFEFAVEEGAGSGSCARCHGGQGYVAYAARLEAGNPAAFTSTELTALGVTTANVEPITCQTCHDPHDATNPNQLRTYNDVAMLPAGFGVAGVGKGALCMTCHNTRNGYSGTPATAWLHDDTAPDSRLTSYSGPHYSSQADVLMGQNAFFVGRGGYDISGHAAITDTCVACHMAESEFGEEYGDHTWTIGEETCAACHGEGVTGEATKESVHMRLVEIEDMIASEAVGDVAGAIGAGTTVYVRAWDEASDCYSSSASSTANVQLTVAPTAATEAHVHGQVGFCFTVPTPITWTPTGTGCPTTPITSSTICTQAGSLKTGNLSTSPALIATTDVLIKAAWNASLILSDGSLGIHNPTWVMDVLRETYDALLTR